ncbi:MAG: protein kinase [Gemmataceae bacterium]|nr:protein kinase [Gemmataceae bacterium]
MTQPAFVDGYEILGELGRGTTGVVYKARFPHIPVISDRLVALKVPSLVAQSEARWRATCFRMECQLLALLTSESDPHFAQLYDVGGPVQEQPLGFYAREFVDGSTLEQLATARSLTLRTGISILATVAEAVSLVHLQGFAHRNLRPSNVLVTAGGMPKLIGFGLVWLLAGTNLLPPGVPGVAPEVDVRALQQMMDWLCATLGQPVPAPLEAMRQPGSIPSPVRFADALNSYLQAG